MRRSRPPTGAVRASARLQKLGPRSITVDTVDPREPASGQHKPHLFPASVAFEIGEPCRADPPVRRESDEEDCDSHEDHGEYRMLGLDADRPKVIKDRRREVGLVGARRHVFSAAPGTRAAPCPVAR